MALQVTNEDPDSLLILYTQLGLKDFQRGKKQNALVNDISKQKKAPPVTAVPQGGGHGGRTRNPCGQLISNQPASHSLILHCHSVKTVYLVKR